MRRPELAALKRMIMGARALTCAALVALGGCGAPGLYVWIGELPQPWLVSARDLNIIESGDLIDIRVYGQADLSVHGRVRTDGTISMPLVGEIEARGRRPAELEEELKKRLVEFLVKPSVTVLVEEPAPVTVSVLGEVARPGQLSLRPNSSLLDAIAAAGGLSEFADRTRIFVLRRSADGAHAVRIRLSYELITRGAGKGTRFLLQPTDTVVVE